MKDVVLDPGLWESIETCTEALLDEWLVAEGDHVVTLFSARCRECIHCLDDRTNLCLAIRDEQNQGHLPDGTMRLTGVSNPPCTGTRSGMVLCSSFLVFHHLHLATDEGWEVHRR